ncbi:MAG: response regulator transcription factor [Phycicoccus sp.]
MTPSTRSRFVRIGVLAAPHWQKEVEFLIKAQPLLPGLRLSSVHARDIETTGCEVLLAERSRRRALEPNSCPRWGTILLVEQLTIGDVLDVIIDDGVAGVIDSGVSAREFSYAVESVAHGGWWLSRMTLDRLRRSVAAPASRQRYAHDSPLGLTRAESAVLHSLVEGHSNAEIARALSVTEATVRSQVRSILRKTGCANRHQLTAQAYLGTLSASPSSFSPQADDLATESTLGWSHHPHSER